ncbi:MAG: helix-turn-helix domain-containing protein [Synergistaceae bacterium]|nr:helix-turn-helix domain-containing protein [Synergistaceae bacterium]
MGQTNFIRFYRLRARLSQKALSVLTGVSFMTVRRWESGLREPRTSEFQPDLLEVFAQKTLYSVACAERRH